MYEDIINEFAGKVRREYDRMVSEVLATYRINVLNQDDLRRRVNIIEDDCSRHFFVDDKYAFTITRFTKAEDDWGVNGKYRLGISYKIEFLDESKARELEKKL